MRCGATDFLGKPVDMKSCTKSSNWRSIPAGNRPTILEADAGAPSDNIYLSSNAQMREIQGLVAQIGWSEEPVLIQGETGVGKEVSRESCMPVRRAAPKAFLKLNCAALPSELVESELFGYERGRFTGAMQKKPGMFEQAEGGTIFLDEIGDMDFKLQAKLLQVLQDRSFRGWVARMSFE